MTTQIHIRLDKSNSQLLRPMAQPFWAQVKDTLISILPKTNQAKRDYEHLAELPDYLLKDLGIQRSEINAKLNKPFWWS